tara:strand:+ start:1708 stop:2355 length:648 start_codon:yes stop_codon:yes gene_type:complete
MSDTTTFNSNTATRPGIVTTFSGSDIKVVFGNIEVGNLQGISWSVNREVRPIFVCGEPNALSYSKNKRGVAGSMVLTCFDRHALRDVMEICKVYRNDATFVPGITEEGIGAGQMNAVLDNQQDRKAVYADEIPPFNAILYGRNEFDKKMRMAIYDITIISEGAGISIDDGIQEAQFTYVARHIDGWRSESAATGTSVQSEVQSFGGSPGGLGFTS